jgi:hypothetical protein
VADLPASFEQSLGLQQPTGIDTIIQTKRAEGDPHWSSMLGPAGVSRHPSTGSVENVGSGPSTSHSQYVPPLLESGGREFLFETSAVVWPE